MKNNKNRSASELGLLNVNYLGRLITLLISVTLFLGGCSQEPIEKLSVGSNIWPGYEPGYFAESKGLFKSGAIEMRQFSSATQVLRAFRNDAIQVAALTLDEALQLAQNDDDVVVFLVADISNGADVILAKPGIASVAGLKGKTIVAEGSALGAFVISRALQLSGLSATDVNVISMTVDESVIAFSEERVDAVVTFEPFRSQLLRQGAEEIFTSKEIPNEIVDVLVTKRSLIDAREEVFGDLAQGWMAAIEMIQTQPELAHPVLATRLELDVAEVPGAFEGLVLPNIDQNRAMLSGSAASLRGVAEILEQVLKERSLLTDKVDIEHLFDARLVR